MTTDTVAKECAVVVEIGGRRITIGGMAKGSGMIHPNMATMLAIVTTDAELDVRVARGALRAATELSFNQVSVDRDTSTNDTLVLLASGAAGGASIQPGTPEATRFAGALEAVCIDLARKVARDGEGASRLITVVVDGARNEVEARRVAREIACSPLVKTAVYGRDPNWGRIMMAIGNAGASLAPHTIDVFIGDVQVAADGGAIPFDAAAVSEAMGANEVIIRVDLNGGFGHGEAWGCDLTEQYVKINAEYTT
jgi:glutamate N-acetyltransferase/amino-acid N-acetyltransferase